MKPGDVGWDDRLEEETDRAVRVIRDQGLHQQEDVLKSFGPVPVFGVWGDTIAPVPLAEVLSLWENDPVSREADREFVRQLRRDDLPPGSFFVLNFPVKGSTYHWRLCVPDPPAT